MLNALVSSEQVRFKQTSETLCTDGRFPEETWRKHTLRQCGIKVYVFHDAHRLYDVIPREVIITKMCVCVWHAVVSRWSSHSV